MNRVDLITRNMGGGNASEQSEEEGDISSQNATPCSFSSCHEVPLLPFKCDGCRKYYCLSHRLVHAHNCLNSSSVNNSVFVCPICRGGVTIVPGESIHVTFERHERGQECIQKRGVKRAPKCPVKGCKERLVKGMAVDCAQCKRQHCALHRSEHNCQPVAPARTMSRLVSAFTAPPATKKSLPPLPSTAISTSPKAKEKSHKELLKETAARRQGGAAGSTSPPPSGGSSGGAAPKSPCTIS